MLLNLANMRRIPAQLRSEPENEIKPHRLTRRALAALPNPPLFDLEERSGLTLPVADNSPELAPLSPPLVENERMEVDEETPRSPGSGDDLIMMLREAHQAFEERQQSGQPMLGDLLRAQQERERMEISNSDDEREQPPPVFTEVQTHNGGSDRIIHRRSTGFARFASTQHSRGLFYRDDPIPTNGGMNLPAPGCPTLLETPAVDLSHPSFRDFGDQVLNEDSVQWARGLPLPHPLHLPTAIRRPVPGGRIEYSEEEIRHVLGGAIEANPELNHPPPNDGFQGDEPPLDLHPNIQQLVNHGLLHHTSNNGDVFPSGPGRSQRRGGIYIPDEDFESQPASEIDSDDYEN